MSHAMRAAPDDSTTMPSQSSSRGPEASRQVAKATIRSTASTESHMGGSVNHRDTFGLYPIASVSRARSGSAWGQSGVCMTFVGGTADRAGIDLEHVRERRGVDDQLSGAAHARALLAPA